MGAVLLAWGDAGARKLATVSDVVVLVDVLRFTTAVTLACARGCTVEASADSSGELLCPARIDELPSAQHVVIGSVNGSAIASTLRDVHVPVIAASLLNANAVAEYVRDFAVVALVPCGEMNAERWRRAALEDALGAGAVASYLPHTGNPAVDAVRGAFRNETDLRHTLLHTLSGRELVERGHSDDVERAAAVDSVPVVPVLTHGVFRA